MKDKFMVTYEKDLVKYQTKPLTEERLGFVIADLMRHGACDVRVAILDSERFEEVATRAKGNVILAEGSMSKEQREGMFNGSAPVTHHDRSLKALAKEFYPEGKLDWESEPVVGELYKERKATVEYLERMGSESTSGGEKVDEIGEE